MSLSGGPNIVPIAVAGAGVLLLLTFGLGKITEYRQSVMERKSHLLSHEEEAELNSDIRARSKGKRNIDIREEYFKIASKMPSYDDTEDWEMKRIPRPESEQVIFKRS